MNSTYNYYHKLLSQNINKLPYEVLAMSAWQCSMEGDGIHRFLGEYVGDDKPRLLRNYLRLVAIASQAIN